ncbi:MAG: methyltransferase domain-containing protein [Rhodospirillaceae bacterium]|nr:methyltransferase domain-containing protein [Rhodospirillales bacterium]
MVKAADPVGASHLMTIALSHLGRGDVTMAFQACLDALSLDPFNFVAHKIAIFCVSNAKQDQVEFLAGLWSNAFLPGFAVEVSEELLIEAFVEHQDRYELFIGLANMALQTGRLARAEEIAYYCLSPLDEAGWEGRVVEEKYDQVANAYDNFPFHAATAQNFLDAVKTRLAGKANLNIVEAACGTGGLAHGLRPYARHLTGIDLSHAMAERAKPHYDSIIVGDMVAVLAGMDRAADAVFCCGATYYLRDLLPFLRGAGAALKPGGLLMFSDFVAPKGGDTMVTAGGTKRYFRSTDLVRALAQEAGLVEIACDYGVSYRIPCRHWCFRT